jgi:Cd2+/Zn2+-exporting ATPase
LSALAIALIPPIFIPGQTFTDWIYRALVMLVISCPCAFVISVPLGYFGGIGGAARRGILVKGGEVLDALAKARVIVFDKTGTLTDGRFAVREILPENGFDDHSLLKAVAAAEERSNHPAALAVRRAWDDRFGEPLPETVSLREIAGHGVIATLSDGTSVTAGHDRILHLTNVAHGVCEVEGTVIHVAVDNIYAGRLLIGDSAKDDAALAVASLRDMGIGRVAMLTGDGKIAAEAAAREMGISEVHANLLPHEKLARLETIMGEHSLTALRGTVIFVGDGINDAPVIARADAGIAMGGSGSDVAVETADAVLVTDEPSRVVEAIVRARRTRSIVIQNIAFALGVKLFFLCLGALGIATMWEAVIADVGVALLAVLNSLRAMR